LAAVWSADRPRQLMVYIGLGLALGAALVIVLEQLARWWVTDGDDTATAVWDAFLEDLSAWAVVVAAVGALLAAIAWFGLRPADARDRFARVWTRLSGPQSRGARVVWGAAVAVLGLVLILRWELSVRFVVSALGAALVAAGAQQTLLAAFPGLADRPADERPSTRGDRRGARVLATVGLLGLGGVLVVALFLGGQSDEDPAAADPGCNGSVVLCERSLDEVVLAATHNSHAAAEDGFTFGYQTVGVVPQLDDGVRALLLDVYFGLETNDVDLVVTDRAPITANEREQLVAEMGEAAVRSAEATVARTAELGGNRDLFLCHAFCEIGARRLVDELEAIAGFLEDHPREVVVMIIQDEGPQPADLADAFAQSGLDQLVYTHDPSGRWPTLGSMIEADDRVVVMAENVSGGVDWYHDAFTLTQDTPFQFDTIDDLTCAPNRGEADSPLLLVNHWLRPVSPRAAEEANQRDVLLERVEQCRRERGLDPNLVAVDFHDRGDVVAVVRELNGL
ncbi:MAG: hypothetical protein OES57_16725, partial [Acidimicrobiia bacterium]|nr:hypothetical protein [Acidimicrobiia bacterium]